jgi:hypothetical protein
MDYDGDLLALSRLPAVKGARALASGERVEITQINGGVVLHVPEARDAADTVIVLELTP